MKLFTTNTINKIEECRVNFGVILPSSLITSKTNKFMFKFQFLKNSFCNIFNEPLYLAYRANIVLHLFAWLFAFFLYCVCISLLLIYHFW